MASCATYYFNSTEEKEGSAEVAQAFIWGTFYHAGSIAFGSLIMALTALINIMAETFAKETENPIARCLTCCARCLSETVEFINTTAYSNMAISGDSFCTSAWNGFILSLKHLVKFYFAK